MNRDRKNDGLPKHQDLFDEIYLYSDADPVPLNENRTLRPQIETVEKNSPWVFAYYVPATGEANIAEVRQILMDNIVSDISKKIRERFTLLFPSFASGTTDIVQEV